MLKTKLENIPELLKKNARWAVYNNGIPSNPITGYGIKNDEVFSYEDIMKYANNFEYLAFRVDKPLKLGFIDLDAHTEDEEKKLKTLLNSFKVYFNSYFEISKSGKGYHILVLTDIEESYKTQARAIGDSRTPIEYYTDKKWCVITGNVIDDKKELNNCDNALQQMLSRFFDKKTEVYVEGSGVSEGERIRENEQVIRLIQSDKVLSELWNNNITNIEKRNGEKVSYNNHTADFVLIRGIMYYCNANKEQAREVFKLSPKYRAYKKGYKREIDITNAIEDSLKSLSSVMEEREFNINEKTDEEKVLEIERKLTTLSEEEQKIMQELDKLFNVTEEEKLNKDIETLDIRTVKQYLPEIESLKLREYISTYIRKRENKKAYLVHFLPNSDLYTTSISDLATLTKIATNNEIFYSKVKESFMKFNGKYWEETDDSMLLSSVHKALGILYDNTFKSVIDIIDILKERDMAIKAYKALPEEEKDSKSFKNITTKYENKLKTEEKFVLTKFDKILKILESNRTPTDVINYIASEPVKDFVTYEETDLLNFQNGTLNLKTGEFKDFDKEDKLANILGCDYNADATCPTFDKFLSSLFSTQSTEIELLKAFASCLVKDTSSKHKKYFFLLQGPTGTGKTTLLNTLLDLMGTYGKSSKYQTFMKTNKEYSGASHNQDIFELIGKQFITCSEPSDTSVFAADFLKAFTGGSTLSIRAAYGRKFVTFKNTGLLFIDSNFTPKIATFDQAAMDRFQVFPMINTPKEEDKDTELAKKLNKELSGIFNRIYEYLKDLDKNPFNASVEMINYKEQYRQESSDILQWLSDTLIETDEKQKLPFLSLYQSYEGWCKINNKTPLSKAFFSSRVKDEAGIKGEKKSGQIVVNGYMFTDLGKVFSKYNTYDKKSSFYKAVEEIMNPQMNMKADKELSYRSIRQSILTKTAYWFADNISINGDLREEKKKYVDYVQECIWNTTVPLCQRDFDSVVEYILTELKIEDILKLSNGEFDNKMLIADEIRRISIIRLVDAA